MPRRRSGSSEQRVAAALYALDKQQDSVVTRAQLRTIRYSQGRVAAQIAANRWKALGPVVVVLRNGPLTYRQQCWAAVLHCGKNAALAGRTAATWDGLAGWESSEIHVVVSRGRTVGELPGIDLVVHESRTHAQTHIHPAWQPRRVRMSRAIIQAAIWSNHARSACGILCAAVQQGQASPAQLRVQLDIAGRVRHKRILRATLDDVDGGARALSEIDFGRLCRRYGLNIEARQEVRRDPDGRRRYIDVTLRGRDGRIIRVEVDGALHLLALNYWADMNRQNERVIQGDRILRFSTVVIRLDEVKVVDQLARALGLPSPRKRAA
jgi:hypothetical protein